MIVVCRGARVSRSSNGWRTSSQSPRKAARLRGKEQEPKQRKAYLWLVGNGGMGYNYLDNLS